tara:strand:- start:2013 stop:2594 length:582 start_codon:yes stop_codon:yes gene_type:complete
MENKKSFILYADMQPTIQHLTDEKAGQLFKIILAYVNDEDPQIDDLILKIAFEPIKQRLKSDLKVWKNKKNIRAEAGRKGGLAKAKNNQVAMLSNAKQNKAKLPVNVIVNVPKGIYREFNHLSITQKEYLKLLEEFKKENIDEVLDSIQNYSNNKKYKSLYLTAKNWLKRNVNNNISSDPLVEYVNKQMNVNK